jgi:hypothetical protein
MSSQTDENIRIQSGVDLSLLSTSAANPKWPAIKRRLAAEPVSAKAAGNRCSRQRQRETLPE